MFSYNGLNRPESKTTVSRRVRQTVKPVWRQMTSFSQVRQVAAPAAKSAVSDSIIY